MKLCVKVAMAAVVVGWVIGTGTAGGQTTDTAQLYNRALDKFDRGDYDGAMLDFNAVLKQTPEDLEAILGLACCYLKKGEYDQALTHLQQVLSLNPDPKTAAMAWNNIGCIHQMSSQDLEQAMRAYREAARLKPDFAEAHVNLGNVHLIMENYTDAAAAYEKAIDLFLRKRPPTQKQTPQQAENLISIALSFVPNNPNGYDRALAAIKPVALKRVGNAALHDNLGFAYQQLSRTTKDLIQKAIFEYAQAAALAPQEALYHAHLGLALYEKGSIESAIVVLRRARQLDPKMPSVHHALGLALTAKGDLQGAEFALKEALTLDPENWAIHFRLATLYERQRRHSEATDAYLKALELRQDPAILNNIGRLLHLQGKYDEAIKYLEQAVSLDTGDAVPQARYNLALSYRAAGRKEEAEATWLDFLKRYSDNTAAKLELADLWIEMEKYNEAVGLLNEVVSRDAKNEQAHLLLGFAHYQLGDLDQAQRAYEQAIKINPKNADALNGLGAVYHRREQWDRAIEYYRRALAADRNHETARRNLDIALKAKEQQQRGQ